MMIVLRAANATHRVLSCHSRTFVPFFFSYDHDVPSRYFPHEDNMRSFFNRERYKNGQAVKVPRDAKRQPVGWVRQRGNTELFEWVGMPLAL